MKYIRSRRNRRYSSKIVSIFKELSVSYEYVREHAQMSSNTYDHLLEESVHYINNVNTIIKGLDPISAQIITLTYSNGEYIDNFWWKRIYSKTTYYRLRDKAIDEFVEGYRLCFVTKRSACLFR